MRRRVGVAVVWALVAALTVIPGAVGSIGDPADPIRIGSKNFNES